MNHSLICSTFTFSLDDYGRPEMRCDGTPLRLTADSELFRVFLDDGVYRELTVHSRDMRGSVYETETGLAIRYEQLIGDDGRVFDIGMTAYIDKTDTGLCFYAEIDNHHEGVRVNEIQYPYLSFDCLCDADRARDALLMPMGLGRKIENPWHAIRDRYHTEYMSADYHQITYSQTYPFPSSMAWFGVQTGRYFLYLGRHDERFRVCVLNAQNTPRHCADALMLSVSHYPAVLAGETVTCGQTLVNLFLGDWRQGAACYRRWADTWYTPYQRPEWVTHLSGWQRIICKHQYGEVFFTYRDLVKAWQDCKEVGLTGLLVFGWWKGCFDNHYPEYEPDPALGGEEELRKAIREIREDGGRVLLYSQGVLIDTQTDYYRLKGKAVCRKDIDGNEYQEFYKFSNDGTLLNQFGYKTFVSACQATDEWQSRLVESAKLKLSFDPDCIFFDQVGGHMPRPCFDTTHKHGNRIDDEAYYRCQNLDVLHGLIGEDQAVGTENTVDCFSPYVQFHHGHEIGTWYEKESFPQMFRQTFPEEVVSNRLLHDDRADMTQQLNYAFIHGLRYDVSIYRGRKCLLGEIPTYANALKRLLLLREQYKEFFYEGTYRLTAPVILPTNCPYGEFHAKDGRVAIAVWNNNPISQEITVQGMSVLVKPQDVAVIVL